MKTGESYLICSDAHLPFENPKALEHAAYCKKHFKIDNENCYSVGDEVDEYFGSLHPKSPNATHSPVSELKEAREKMKEWMSVFPKLKLCTSNHGLRWVRKATDSQIPSELIRSYEEILGAPPNWIWKDEWRVGASNKCFRIIHGTGYSGKDGHRNAALDAGLSTVIGHLHSFAGVDFINSGQNIWAMNVGCLIDIDSYAFEYGKNSRNKPTLGLGIVLNGGELPVFIPL